ncbi:hypothetical protein MYX65_01210 [Acidobacteria bacterium AH-259-L09]|nr:hypothetical protein [Acidobacteria bacterium AH-259-L09]
MRNSTEENIQNTAEKPRRPLGVWIISIFYLLSILSMSLSYYLIFTNTVTLPPAQIIESYSVVDYLVMLGVFALSIMAAVNLFLLRKVAVLLFYALLALNVLLSALYYLFTDVFQALPSGVGVGQFLGLLITGWICLYSRKLQKKDILR